MSSMPRCGYRYFDAKVVGSPDDKIDEAAGAVTDTSKIFCKIGIVAISFVFDKYCLIMD